jgi:hypothetical protein
VSPRPKVRPLIPQIITLEQMKLLSAGALYLGMKERAGLDHIRISIRAVKPGPWGQFIPATPSEFVSYSNRTLDYYSVEGYSVYMVEGTYDVPTYDPDEKLTRAEFLVDLLDRLDSFAESLKYSPALYEQVRAEVDTSQHYLRGAFDIAELADLSYLSEETENAPVSL